MKYRDVSPYFRLLPHKAASVRAELVLPRDGEPPHWARKPAVRILDLWPARTAALLHRLALGGEEEVLLVRFQTHENAEAAPQPQHQQHSLQGLSGVSVLEISAVQKLLRWGLGRGTSHGGSRKTGRRGFTSSWIWRRNSTSRI